ncbi:hypothetical protein CL654_02685 [bacterium]|nr:hypothetical protein [bacterium]|tara:strand:+ start:27422 stop:27829 length:408 start_codon:yes stop_codon:yes gene_type:complete
MSKFEQFPEPEGRRDTNMEEKSVEELESLAGPYPSGPEYAEKEEKMSIEDVKSHPNFDEILQEKALEYLKNKDSDWFYSRFSGEVSSEGYLLDNDGNETNWLPSQNLGGPAYVEVIKKVRDALGKKDHAEEGNTE